MQQLSIWMLCQVDPFMKTSWVVASFFFAIILYTLVIGVLSFLLCPLSLMMSSPTGEQTIDILFIYKFNLLIVTNFCLNVVGKGCVFAMDICWMNDKYHWLVFVKNIRHCLDVFVIYFIFAKNTHETMHFEALPVFLFKKTFCFLSLFFINFGFISCFLSQVSTQIQ